MMYSVCSEIEKKTVSHSGWLMLTRNSSRRIAQLTLYFIYSMPEIARDVSKLLPAGLLP